MQDISQIHGGIEYDDIMKFGDKHTDNDIKRIRNITELLNEAHEEDNEKEADKYASNISRIVKQRNSAKKESGFDPTIVPDTEEMTDEEFERREYEEGG